MSYHTIPDIDSILEKFSQIRALIIGDVMIDSYLYGKVERISPESPVPVVEITHSEYRLGGAANVALNVKALGAETILCSATGTDAESGIFNDLLTGEGLSTEGIINFQDRPTTIKNRILCRNHQMLRFDKETSAYLSPEQAKAFIANFKKLLAKYEFDIVIFQDYNKGILTPEVIESVITETQKRGILTAVDPKKKNFLCYKNVTLFKPNLREINEGLNIEMNGSEIEDLKKAATEIKKQLNNRYTFITLSEKGIYLSNDSEHLILPAHIRNVSDVSGAGDTVVSVAALGLAARLPLHIIGVLSNIAGGLVCEEAGVVPVKIDKLIDATLEWNININP